MIKRIQKFRVFTTKTKSEKKQELEDKAKRKTKRLTVFDLLPNFRTDPAERALKYNLKALCKIAAVDDYDTEQSLYYDRPLSETWEQIAMNLAQSKSQDI